MPESAAFTRTPTDRDRQQDVLLAVVMLVGGVISAALSTIAGLYGDEQAPMWWALLVVVGISLPLIVRRRYPAAVAIVIALVMFTSVTLRVPEIYATNIAMFVALYTVGAWMNDRRRAFFVRAGIILGMFIWLLIVMYRDAIDEADKADVAAGLFSPFVAFMMINLLINVLYFGGAYYFGERSWQAAAQRFALEERTRELEAQREITAAQAVALDRVRIARELHDVVAHHVSVMGVQAGAARLVIDSDPDEAKRMLAGVEQASREAIRDFRQLLETLRDPGDGGSDEPSSVGLADIERLAQASRDAGLPTDFTVIGEPVAVPSTVEVNLYRIAQEALTNARRHAGSGASADVRLRWVPDAVELEIVNTGRSVGVLRPGLGQLGMRERALASGGEIELQPRPQGGFRVRVAVPLGASSEFESREVQIPGPQGDQLSDANAERGALR
ncbi:sensor histidine kinase [Microbacterium esteraromaticum]|uniref:sensor histidine kinase n=1 Tax=Microbacterium esteraromaticum TaxID=57043 RepID=UPI00195EB387|nr:sensor histidine kinase [Microbacterium esteraromaticum]MBM7465832.1 signal transduction histidine kinase [Microbacterium esteraromaticum]